MNIIMIWKSQEKFIIKNGQKNVKLDLILDNYFFKLDFEKGNLLCYKNLDSLKNCAWYDFKKGNFNGKLIIYDIIIYLNNK